MKFWILPFDAKAILLAVSAESSEALYIILSDVILPTVVVPNTLERSTFTLSAAILPAFTEVLASPAFRVIGNVYLRVLLLAKYYLKNISLYGEFLI